jgi:hypothetical protein
MAVDACYRDRDGEISRKHGHTLIGSLRTSYGGRFAKGRTDDEKLSDVLTKLDESSLFKLVRDHKAGMLPAKLGRVLTKSGPMSASVRKRPNCRAEAKWRDGPNCDID